MNRFYALKRIYNDGSFADVEFVEILPGEFRKVSREIMANGDMEMTIRNGLTEDLVQCKILEYRIRGY